ncbi:MAG: hypothetical protein U0325_33230 [Polyangiales bacterium]
MRFLAVVCALAVVSCSSAPPVPPRDASAPPDTASVDAGADAPSVADAVADAVELVDGAAETGLAWSEVAPSGAAPTARWGTMIADRGDGTALVYGGTNLDVGGRGTVSRELWRFDGRSDPPTWTLVSGEGAAPTRYCGCVGWLPTTRTLLMVGGRNPAESAPETWAFDEMAGTWSRRPTRNTPPGVIGCQMAWSSARGALYLFGGGGQTAGFSNRIWRWDPADEAWVMLDATGPRARYDDALVPLHDGRHLLMVAGARTAQAGAGFFNDVWRFDTMTETWAQVTVEGDAPPGRRTPWISVDADDGGFVMALGSAGVQPGETLDDLWRFDLRAGRWSPRMPDPAPTARGWSGALPGRGDVRGYVFGGFDNRAARGDLWRLRAVR